MARPRADIGIIDADRLRLVERRRAWPQQPLREVVDRGIGRGRLGDALDCFGDRLHFLALSVVDARRDGDHELERTHGQLVAGDELNFPFDIGSVDQRAVEAAEIVGSDAIVRSGNLTVLSADGARVRTEMTHLAATDQEFIFLDGDRSAGFIPFDYFQYDVHWHHVCLEFGATSPQRSPLSQSN